MSYGMVSGSETCFHFCPKLPTRLTYTISNPQNCSGFLLKTNLDLVIKQSRPMKLSPGLRRGRTRAAAVHCLYGVKHEKNLYELLGVSEKGTTSEIKQAYKKLALKYHPDVSPPDRAAEHARRFIRVREAYETLSDPKTRAMYDRDLGRGLRFDYSRQGRSHRDQVFALKSLSQVSQFAHGKRFDTFACTNINPDTNVTTTVARKIVAVVQNSNENMNITITITITLISG